MINDNILNCRRCRHTWSPRIKKSPKYCPKCKSPYWNKPVKKISKSFVEGFKKNIVVIQKNIILTSGGLEGIRDDGGLYASSYNIIKFIGKRINQPFKIGAAIFGELSRKHHFNDGNKRIAFVLAKAILLRFRYHLKLPYNESVKFILKIAEYESRITFKEIEEWLENNCEKIKESEIDKYLKLNLFDLIYDEDGKRGGILIK